VDRSDITGNRNISDLEIQSILGDALKHGSKPNGESIFVVYLDPTIHSTLGALVAEKHYMAYHGFLNFSGMKIHYAVVPFESDVEAGYQIALRTFIVAALHSEDTPH
jgi:predicted methyltransferase